MMALGGLKDKYIEMLLTAGPNGKKNEILLDQIKWLAR